MTRKQKWRLASIPVLAGAMSIPVVRSIVDNVEENGASLAWALCANLTLVVIMSAIGCVVIVKSIAQQLEAVEARVLTARTLSWLWRSLVGVGMVGPMVAWVYDQRTDDVLNVRPAIALSIMFAMYAEMMLCYFLSRWLLFGGQDRIKRRKDSDSTSA